MFNAISQVGTVTWLGLRTIGQRLGSSLATIFGVMGVVGVLIVVLSIGEGFRKALVSSGSDDTALVLRSGSDNEMTSGLLRDSTFVLPHMKTLFAKLTPGTPAIHFGTGTAALLPLLREAGGDVIGLDWRVELAAGWASVGHDVAVQGNLDPAVLLAAPAYIRTRAQAILQAAGGRPGHIFNLGHGIHKETPVEHVKALVDIVHELSARR